MHESLNREHVIGGLHVTENNFNVTRVTSHKHEVKLLKPIEILIHFRRYITKLGKKPRGLVAKQRLKLEKSTQVIDRQSFSRRVRCVNGRRPVF